MTKKRKLGGFTLIEVLVVVLIIGILTSIAIPQYQQAVFKARMAEAETLVNTLYYSLLRYYEEHHALPPVAEGNNQSPEDFDAYLDVSIPPLKSYFKLNYHSGDYLGISCKGPSGKTIYINRDWRQNGIEETAYLYCAFWVGDSSDPLVRKYCASVCGNNDFEAFGDAIACRIG